MRGALGKWTAAAVTSVLLIGGLSACGSSSSHSSSGTNGGSATTAANQSASAHTGKQVVRVFGFGIETDPALGGLFPKATYVTGEPELAAKSLNGSSTSKVEIQYTYCDTKGEASGTIACAKQATSSTACDGHPCDVAFDTGDINDDLSVPVIAKSGLPVVSASSSGTLAASSPDNFCLTSGTNGIYGGLAYVAKSLGASKVGIIGLQLPDAQVHEDAITESAKTQGLGVSGAQLLASTSVSPNAAIASAMTGGADGLIDTAVGNVGAALKYVGNTYAGAKIAIPVQLITKSFFNGLPTSLLNGVGVSAWSQPVTATSVPGIAEFRQEGGLSVAGSQYSGIDFTVLSWLGIRFIANVADGVSGPVTPSSMLHALRTANDVNMLGIVPPWSASERGKNGADACSPYHSFVAEKLENDTQVAAQVGVFRDATTGKVVYRVGKTTS
jgi:hypothetical protein